MYALKINPESSVLERIENLEEDIAQSIEVILLTPKGSKIFEPEFGSELYKFIDNVSPAVIPRIIAEVWEALQRWEPRIRLINVDVERFETEGSYKLVLKIEYEIKELALRKLQELKL
ncbi:GPW/gp25 family protein [Persephonella sp.]